MKKIVFTLSLLIPFLLSCSAINKFVKDNPSLISAISPGILTTTIKATCGSNEKCLSIAKGMLDVIEVSSDSKNKKPKAFDVSGFSEKEKADTVKIQTVLKDFFSGVVLNTPEEYKIFLDTLSTTRKNLER